MVPKFSNPESLRIGTKVGRFLMRADRTGTVEKIVNILLS